MMSPDEAMEKLLQKGREMAEILNQADKAGYKPRVEFDWNPGMTALFQITQCWNCKVTINGITLVADPDYPHGRQVR